MRVFVSQGSSSLAVEERTLPQYFEHGESGVTKMDAASGADTTVATARCAAEIRIVDVFDTFLQDLGLLYGIWLKDLIVGGGSAELVNPGRGSPSSGRGCGGRSTAAPGHDYCRTDFLYDIPMVGVHEERTGPRRG